MAIYVCPPDSSSQGENCLGPGPTPGACACDWQLRWKSLIPQRKRRGDLSLEPGGAARDSGQAKLQIPCAGEERRGKAGN